MCGGVSCVSDFSKDAFLCSCVSAEVLSSIPEIAKLGPLFKSSDKPLELTESETEYVVKCVKHAFADHIVFQVCLCTSVWGGGKEVDVHLCACMYVWVGVHLCVCVCARVHVYMHTCMCQVCVCV